MTSSLSTSDPLEIDLGFLSTCRNGNLTGLRRQCLAFTESQVHNINYGYRAACEWGQLGVIHYLLHDPELSAPAKVESEDYLGFRLACNRGQADVVRYLLTQVPSMEAMLQVEQFSALRWACEQSQQAVVQILMTETPCPQLLLALPMDEYENLFKTIHTELGQWCQQYIGSLREQQVLRDDLHSMTYPSRGSARL